MSEPLKLEPFHALEIVFERLSDFAVDVIEGQEPETDDPEEEKAYALRSELAELLNGFLWELQQIAEGKALTDDQRFSSLDRAALKALWPVRVDLAEEGDGKKEGA